MVLVLVPFSLVLAQVLVQVLAPMFSVGGSTSTCRGVCVCTGSSADGYTGDRAD